MQVEGLVEGLNAAQREAVLALCERVKHDLGRYIALQQRWLGEDATEAEREAAVRADLLETRRSEQRTSSASEVWAGLRPQLFGEEAVLAGLCVDLSGDVDAETLRRVLLELEPEIACLAADSGYRLGPRLGAVAAGCDQVAAAAASLVRRVRGGMRG